MVNVDTFPMMPYGMVDGFCGSELPAAKLLGSDPAFCRKVITRAVFLGSGGAWAVNRVFTATPNATLRRAFSNLPHRAPFDRPMSRHRTPSRLSPCIWSSDCKPDTALMKCWIARPCQLAMPGGMTLADPQISRTDDWFTFFARENVSAAVFARRTRQP